MTSPVRLERDSLGERAVPADACYGIQTQRAIETRRFLLRAGNIGVTAVIDPRGRVTQALPVKQAGTLQARFALQEGQTWYVRLGNWPVGGSALGLLGLACARWRVKRTPR